MKVTLVVGVRVVHGALRVLSLNACIVLCCPTFKLLLAVIVFVEYIMD